MGYSTILDIVISLGAIKKESNIVKQTWWGSAIGQTTVAVALILGYATIILAAFKFLYAPEFQQLYKQQPLVLIFALTFPVFIILVFFSLPAHLRTLRERKLRPLAESNSTPKPGYFRLQPYQIEDAVNFVRPDRAVEEAIGWLKRTTDVILYLSGASGVGKSSLINAALAPNLIKNKWSVHILRGLGEPLDELKKFLNSNPQLFDSDEIGADDTVQIFDNINRYRRESGLGPLLIILDQFEEYLILDGNEEAIEYAHFLLNLTDKPFTHIKLLHVFREDYRALLFKQALPDYIVNQNGFDLAPFNRREAEEFLRNAPRHLITGYDELFIGLDKIESKGLYRPITLNMVGFVLEREGSNLTQDPRKLIECYLKDCITSNNTQDLIKPILSSMITPSGTKQIRKVGEIAESTGIADWQVKGILVGLSKDGLLRPLTNEQWEVSHDFLARLMSVSLATIKKPFFFRVRPMALLVIIGWSCAVFMALPLWTANLEKKALTNEIATLDQLRLLGFVRLADADEGWNFRNQNSASLTNAQLKMFSELVKGYNVKRLDLSSASNVTDLSYLKNLPIRSLNLSYMKQITDLSPLRDMPITHLALGYNDQITDLSPLKELPLTHLELRSMDAMRDISILKGMSLQTLKMSNMYQIEDLSTLEDMPLTTIEFISMNGIKNLKNLKNLPLKSLKIVSSSGISDLSPLKDIDLVYLDLPSMSGIIDVTPLKDMPLMHLGLYNCDGIADLSPLEDLPVTTLNIGGMDGIITLRPLKKMYNRGVEITTNQLSPEVLKTLTE